MAIGLSGFPDGVHEAATSRGAQAGRAGLRATRGAAGHPGGAADYTRAASTQAAGPQAGDSAKPLLRKEPGEPWSGGDAAPAQPDSKLLKKSLTQLEPDSQKAMAYFFATLFVRYPELRPMFPLALDTHRHRVFAALARYAWSSDRPESLTGWLTDLAREHRKFGVRESHFRPFCDALLTALRSFGDGPSAAQTQDAWRAALDHVEGVMAGAVRDAQQEPAWWLAEVVAHERRRPGLAVVTLRPDQPLPYQAGQHVSVQVPRWPRVWREYSVANAPEASGLLRLHVRAVPCGHVSSALVNETTPGDTVVLGPARGGMTATAGGAGGPGERVVCFAGGTGLAPVKAIVEQLTAGHCRRPAGSIQLFFGARDEPGLYDAPDLRRLAGARPALAVIPVVSDDPGYDGLRGTLAEAAARHLHPDTCDVFVSGPPEMVTATTEAAAARAPAARIHADPQPGPGAAAATPAPGPRGPHLVPWWLPPG